MIDCEPFVAVMAIHGKGREEIFEVGARAFVRRLKALAPIFKGSVLDVYSLSNCYCECGRDKGPFDDVCRLCLDKRFEALTYEEQMRLEDEADARVTR